ncbi:MAG: PqqD family protein [Acidobacteriota bacterium]
MRVEKSTHTVFTPLDDGTGVLLNLETRFYYSLNRTGVALWRELEQTNPSTIDDLVRATCEQFGVDEDVARREIAAFVGQLEDFRMVRVL